MQRFPRLELLAQLGLPCPVALVVLGVPSEELLTSSEPEGTREPKARRFLGPGFLVGCVCVCVFFGKIFFGQFEGEAKKETKQNKLGRWYNE